jgi:putative integral membrane protein (TIGR02587 family)
VMHAFVYALNFRGELRMAADTPVWEPFFRYTTVGYLVALAMSAYSLWTFGRMDGLSPEQVLTLAIVLGFPAALGAAAARLVL